MSWNGHENQQAFGADKKRAPWDGAPNTAGERLLAFRFRRFHARQENNWAGREGGDREQIKGVYISDHAGLPADLAGQPGERGGAVHRRACTGTSSRQGAATGSCCYSSSGVLDGWV